MVFVESGVSPCFSFSFLVSSLPFPASLIAY
jgi:hypothetical protein